MLRRKKPSKRASHRQTWPSLLWELAAAEVAQRKALAAFTKAERMLFSLPARERKLSPHWYRAAYRDVVRTGAVLDRLHRRIAAEPASGKRGIRMKVNLLATVYCVSLGTPARTRKRDDLAAQLIRSLIVDLGGRAARNR